MFFKDNALVLRPNGSGYITTVTHWDQIAKLIGNEAEQTVQMISFGTQPISFHSIDLDSSGASSTESEKVVVWFIRNAVTRGQSLPPADPEDYDYHRITSPEMVQMFCHEEGIMRELPYNIWWSHSNATRRTQPLYGNVVILGQCCDELPNSPPEN